MPMDMIVEGLSMRRFQASQPVTTAGIVTLIELAHAKGRV